MKQLRVAILGQGRSGHNIHGTHLKKVPDMYKIVAVVDPLEERRIKAQEEYGCEAYESHCPLLDRKDLDIIINATPSHLHVPITLEFLERGFNVLCEKPLARKTSDVDRLINASEKSGKLLAIYQQSRFAPYFRKVKEIVDSGDLGRIVQISIAFNSFARRWDWQCLQDHNGGSLLNTGPHPLDQALRFLKYDGMPDVVCRMDRANTFGDAEDYVKLILMAPDRPLIDIEMSSCCAYQNFTYNVQGTNGGLQGSMTHIDWKYFRPEEAPEQKLTITPITNEDGTPAFCREKLAWCENSWNVPEESKELFPTMAARFYEMLYRTLVDGTPLEITTQQVRQQIAVIEECHRQNPLSRRF